jgi:hypothetical protein
VRKGTLPDCPRRTKELSSRWTIALWVVQEICLNDNFQSHVVSKEEGNGKTDEVVIGILEV